MKEIEESLKLRYYYDALCGWCYGFSSVMSQISEAYGSNVEIEVISGGLFLGQRAGKVNVVAPHIKAGAYQMVESRTGVKFGPKFLEDVFDEGNMTLDSLPPAVALCIVKELNLAKAAEFAGTLLKAVYYDGMDPIDLDSYAPYVKDVDIEWETFITLMKDEQYISAANMEFRIFRSSPYSGMPALVIADDNQEIVLSSGYTSFENIKMKIDQYLPE